MPMATYATLLQTALQQKQVSQHPSQPRGVSLSMLAIPLDVYALSVGVLHSNVRTSGKSMLDSITLLAKIHRSSKERLTAEETSSTL